MKHFQEIVQKLEKRPRKWLVTGAAGFIGSNLVEFLLKHKQIVRGLDNFSTGNPSNLQAIKNAISTELWNNFTFTEGDIRNKQTCLQLCKNVDYVLHQAAIGSVPRSIDDPDFTNDNNINGFLTMLLAAKEAQVKNFVYAASSSTYGDSDVLPKREDCIGAPLSPYAVTKYVNELYAKVFHTCYGLNTVGLRYFNIFGQRQDPSGAYAAVIPLWFKALLQNEPVYINGDGSTSRDFCYIDNCIQANILAACAKGTEALNQVYNIAVGQQTSLLELFAIIKQNVGVYQAKAREAQPIHREPRKGDVLHSLADISKAQKLLGYSPQVQVKAGIKLAAAWYEKNLR